VSVAIRGFSDGNWDVRSGATKEVAAGTVFHIIFSRRVYRVFRIIGLLGYANSIVRRVHTSIEMVRSSCLTLVGNSCDCGPA
jgi:hypothetical protein